ncbi:uncharacterized protein LOC125178661 [Hyalella azteca]|uniref:Uncharacterized protein LOC125178661 n=1 Tax=Hyalella azteca TaxID=294128 RepID=A0A979FQE5_HYAAZ|nr:uncharacterized protein LOC125178661 [Hyalella azteca]
MSQAGMSQAEMCEFEGRLYNLNEKIGCLQCTDIGVTYGDQGRRRVADIVLPPRDTCCAQASNGYCLVAECSAYTIGFCEAKARCAARGLPMASKELYYNPGRIVGNLASLGTNQVYFWANIHRGADMVWRWMPSMEAMGNVISTYNGNTDGDCAEMLISGGSISFYLVSCQQNDEECVLCYDPATSLPPC